ncbi:MAG: hypothetical protein V1891_02430 [bacterium]
MSGLLNEDLLAYCGKYNEFYFNQKVANKLYELNDEFNIFIFTSYPKEIFQFLKEKKIVNKVFGAEPCFDNEGKVKELKEINLRNIDGARKKMEEFGFGKKFTLEPDIFGLTELLIENMIADNLNIDDIVVLGRGLVVYPAYKLAGRVIERLEEI